MLEYLPCLKCNGAGQTYSLKGEPKECAQCHGTSQVRVPNLPKASLLRWLIIADFLILQPRPLEEMITQFQNEPWQASLFGILGVMNESGIIEKNHSSWQLTKGGIAWRGQWCEKCRGSLIEDRHELWCSLKPIITAPRRRKSSLCDPPRTRRNSRKDEI